MPNPFHFYTRLNLTELLGRKAKNISELLEGIKAVPGSSIYYHTHRFLQQHHFLSPEPPNDFAYWVSNILQEEKIGEQLAAVDIIQFKKIHDLREKFISIIEGYLKTKHGIREAPASSEFHFMKSVTFVIPTQYVANNLAEFLDAVKKISIHSIYFHIFEARLRLEKGNNDFSNWLGNELNEAELAKKISRLDPYTQTLESLRQKIIYLAEKRLNAQNK
ncbi:MAG: hypothetical protein COS68_01840 [Elusimicrobia bacterium CG06_land_8_20_14_3_00_38_11]|nr:MAG: hypothetical protein COS68_01840 [Elusimicrobia bacterium CG06_land_8_20_14_3_00_38_11]